MPIALTEETEEFAREKAKTKQEEFESLAKPLIKYLNENWNPHCTIIIDGLHAELLMGEMVTSAEDLDEN